MHPLFQLLHAARRLASLRLQSWEISLEAQGNIHQRDHHRHLDQGADDRGKCRSGIDSEHRDRDRDGQLEIVRGGGK